MTPLQDKTSGFGFKLISNPLCDFISIYILKHYLWQPAMNPYLYQIDEDKMCWSQKFYWSWRFYCFVSRLKILCSIESIIISFFSVKRSSFLFHPQDWKERNSSMISTWSQWCWVQWVCRLTVLPPLPAWSLHHHKTSYNQRRAY